ncbi:hypothetical protein [Saccharospirillum sp. MSK14-1]|uniref:hypothetical protein n=1 Tax=Saccharospirillum sp. MSK14-1 TaxID=1897632 RepID=UPI0018EE7FBA|nr:hypothetical protein [Saccharospirillum sp. MSK14-1]
MKPKHIGILLGVLYGASFRLFFMWLVSAIDADLNAGVGWLVSISFLCGVPFAIGYIRIHFELQQNPSLPRKRMIIVAWQPIFIFLLAAFVTFIEGTICIALALPAFMLLSSLGGLLAGWVHRVMFQRKNGTLLSVAVLPVVIWPLEIQLPSMSQTYQVHNEIVIDAPADVIWRQLASVTVIEDGELPLSFNQLIGVPRPVEARMDASGVGAVRTSYWEKGVVFKEVITGWETNQRMAYDFDIDPEKIPDEALDPHVKLGGEYFSPLNGEYRISENSQGETVLHLQTTLVDNTNFGWYSRLWGEIIFRDFHRSLLVLMKNRAEAAASA